MDIAQNMLFPGNSSRRWDFPAKSCSGWKSAASSALELLELLGLYNTLNITLVSVEVCCNKNEVCAKREIVLTLLTVVKLSHQNFRHQSSP